MAIDPDLYIKWNSTDDGTRPVPDGGAFWASPSIWITNAAGDRVTTADGQPLAFAGAVNLVHVTVDGTAESPTYSGAKVQVWVCDCSTTPVGPDSSRHSAGDQQGRTGTISSAVSKNASGTTYVSWRPDVDTDLINGANPGEGHLCVGANVYYEGLPGPLGAQLTAGTLDVKRNRHHAQCNVTVKKVSNLQAPMVLRLAALGAEEEQFQVRGWELDREGGIGSLEQELLLAHCFVDLVGGKPKPRKVPGPCQTEPFERTWLAGGGRLTLTGMPEPTEIRAAGHDARFTLLTEESCRGGGGKGDGGVHLHDGGDDHGGWGGGDGDGGDCDGGARARLTVRPGERTPVLVNIECDGDPGEVHTIDVVQQTPDGVVLGGARLVALHVPDWFGC
ncbi:hypothetical protein OG223_11205 [Streptomyces sp. NBC_01478]|uniref:hypothetical protein n=1 Tax=Streptomyces sp. NBC_01478 TaxID=2903882 RepID=UPI002E35A3C9|nr:hypothetical protein [Streptomyces sp. NBC_01478]